MAWYTPGLAPRPLLFKFDNQEGVIQIVSELKIKSTYDKCYDGSSVTEYKSEAVIGEIRYGFKLIFYTMDNRRVMVI